MNRKIMLAAAMMVAGTTAFAAKVDNNCARGFNGFRLGVSVGYYSSKAKDKVTTVDTKLKGTSTKIDAAKKAAFDHDFASELEIFARIAAVKEATKDMDAADTEKYMVDNGYEDVLMIVKETPDIGLLNKGERTGELKAGFDNNLFQTLMDAAAPQINHISAQQAYVAIRNGMAAVAVGADQGDIDAVKEAARVASLLDGATQYSVVRAAREAAAGAFYTVSGRDEFSGAKVGLNAKEVLNRKFNALNAQLSSKALGFIKDGSVNVTQDPFDADADNNSKLTFVDWKLTVGNKEFTVFNTGNLSGTDDGNDPITGAQANRFAIDQFNGVTAEEIIASAHDQGIIQDKYDYKVSSDSTEKTVAATENSIKNTKANIASGLFFEAGKTMSNGFYIGGRLSGDAYVGAKGELVKGLKATDEAAKKSLVETTTGTKKAGVFNPSNTMTGLTVRPRFSVGLELQLGYANDRNRFYGLVGGKLTQVQATFTRDQSVTDANKKVVGDNYKGVVVNNGIEETLTYTDFVTAPTSTDTATAAKTSTKKSKTKFGVTLGAGFSTMVSSKVFIDVRYEYAPKVKYKFATPTFDVKSIYDAANYGELHNVSMSSHKVTIGFGYQF